MPPEETLSPSTPGRSASSVSNGAPVASAAASAARPPLSFQADSAQIGSPLPSRRVRPSPAYDPLLRAQISRTAKWLMLVGILLFVAWLPSTLYISEARMEAIRASGNSLGLDPSFFWFGLVAAASVYGTVVATGLWRLILPKVFGRWNDAAEALRDWLAVGLVTGGIYFLAISVLHGIGFGPAGRSATMGQWAVYRAPVLLLSAILGLFVSRLLAIRREGVLSDSAGVATLQIALQAVLLILLEQGFERVFVGIYSSVALVRLLGVGAVLCAFASVGIIGWAFGNDSHLTSIRRRRGATGINDGTGPVSLTVTVIGGRESGKTVLMAAAFYEWSTQSIGNLRITPTQSRVSEATAQAMENLEDVARELYVDNQFPIGTVSTQNLPFDLSLGQEKIAQFSFLDYPGGAIAGKVPNAEVVQDFWDRVDDTDGIIMIADMSYVRRATKDTDWMEVRNAYRQVMQRLVDRNGKRRVVPVALVLTKCDEFINPDTGRIDVPALQAGLQAFQYDQLEKEWRDLNADAGPGVVEFSTWITSAITYSRPQVGLDGEPDMTKPFEIAPAPPSITPTGCASPLLWMTSKAMRWNVTLFYDISRFIFGSSQTLRRRIDAVMELETLANERAGR